VKAAALAVRFLVAELGALAALAAWAFDAFDGVAALLGAVVLVGVVIALWALFVAPKASRRLRDPARFALEAAIFAAATAGLVAAGHVWTGIVYAALALASAAAVRVWPEPA
jgi:uncharacterized protein DUF2568